MKFVQTYDDFLLENHNEKAGFVIPIAKQLKAFDGIQGKWIDLSSVREKFIECLINEYSKINVKFVKKYKSNDIDLIEFDQKIYGGKITVKQNSEIWQKAEKVWHEEAQKLFKKG